MHTKEFRNGFSGYGEHGQLLYDVTKNLATGEVLFIPRAPGAIPIGDLEEIVARTKTF